MLMLLFVATAWASSEVSTAVSAMPALSTGTGRGSAAVQTQTSTEAIRTETFTGARHEGLPRVDTGTGGEGQRTATGVQKTIK